MLNSIFRLGETRPEQEWSNGTESSGYSDFSEFLANLARYTQNFGIKFLKISVPFGVFGIFGPLLPGSRGSSFMGPGYEKPLLFVLRPRRVKDISRPSAFSG